MKSGNNASVHEPYRLYLYDPSYYSGKMEMYLRCKQIPFERIEASAVRMVGLAYKNTGVMKVPFIQTRDGKWLKDTTPMIEWFEKQYRETEVIPKTFWKWPGSPRNVDEGDPLVTFRYDQTFEFLDAIRNQRPCVPSFHDGARAQAVMDAAILSAREQRWVEPNA